MAEVPPEMVLPPVARGRMSSRSSARCPIREIEAIDEYLRAIPMINPRPAFCVAPPLS